MSVQWETPELAARMNAIDLREPLERSRRARETRKRARRGSAKAWLDDYAAKMRAKYGTKTRGL